MGERDAEQPATPLARRRVVLLFAALAAVAIALRLALALFAADLFVGVVRRSLASSGLAVSLQGEPEVSLSGFHARGVMLQTTEGAAILTAKTVSGDTAFSLSAPHLRVSLELSGARIAAQARGGTAKGPALAAILPVLPDVISSIRLEKSAIDLGAGRTARIDGAAASDASGKLSVSIARLDYGEPSGERAAEKLQGTLEMAAGTGRFEIALDSGSVLEGAVLLDFAAHPLHASAVVAGGAGGATVLSEITCTLGKLVAVTGRAAVSRSGSLETADVVLSSDDLGPAFDVLVREPFGGALPPLADATIDGRGRAALRIEKPSRQASDATVTLSVPRLHTRALDAESLDVDLPWIGSGLRGVAPRAGHLRARRLALSGVPWDGLDAALSAAPGTLRASGVLTWSVFGGALRISGLTLTDDPHDGPRASADVRVEHVDLAEAGRAFGVAGLSGHATGDLGRLTLDADALRTTGTLDLDTMRGSVRLANLFVEQPFGRVPAFGLDATVDGIDLESLTTFLGVGSVSGVLEGHVKGLVIAAGQPQAFDADLHSTERRGVPQTIDVRAIVQLGVLGGGDSGSLTGTLLSAIHKYRYSAMGLRCRLRNDVFEIRGVETSGGKDYLVKGSLLPPTVSVVSHSQVISFSEMLRRIERVASIGEGGTPSAAPE